MPSISSLRRDLSLSQTELSKLAKDALRSPPHLMQANTNSNSPAEQPTPPAPTSTADFPGQILMHSVIESDDAPGPPPQLELRASNDEITQRLRRNYVNRNRLRYPVLPKEIPLSPIQTKEEMHEAIERIGKKYIYDTSELQVNISSRNRRLVIRRIERARKDFATNGDIEMAIDTIALQPKLETNPSTSITASNNNSNNGNINSVKSPASNEKSENGDINNSGKRHRQHSLESSELKESKAGQLKKESMEKREQLNSISSGGGGKKKNGEVNNDRKGKETLTLDSISKNIHNLSISIDFETGENENEEMTLIQLQQMFDDCCFEVLRLLRSSFRNFADTREYRLFVSRFREWNNTH